MPNETFEVVPGFCPDCGAILPPLGATGGIQCFACNRKFPATVFDNSKVSYTIYFNSRDVYEQNNEKVKMEKTEKGEEPEEGPVVERKCPNCGNERMSYATLQLRSADEGQTVFYTCTKCKFKEPEEGPVVERKCPNCGNERMSYATLQLRSADEGQTVFYTCTKCKFKETENS